MLRATCEMSKIVKSLDIDIYRHISIKIQIGLFVSESDNVYDTVVNQVLTVNQSRLLVTTADTRTLDTWDTQIRHSIKIIQIIFGLARQLTYYNWCNTCNIPASMHIHFITSRQVLYTIGINPNISRQIPQIYPGNYSGGKYTQILYNT